MHGSVLVHRNGVIPVCRTRPVCGTACGDAPGHTTAAGAAGRKPRPRQPQGRSPFAGNYVPGNASQIEAVYLDPRWLSTMSPLADYAIARVHRDAPGTLQFGGGLAIGAAPTNGTSVTITGYPRGVGGGPIE